MLIIASTVATAFKKRKALSCNQAAKRYAQVCLLDSGSGASFKGLEGKGKDLGMMTLQGLIGGLQTGPFTITYVGVDFSPESSFQQTPCF